MVLVFQTKVYITSQILLTNAFSLMLVTRIFEYLGNRARGPAIILTRLEASDTSFFEVLRKQQCIID